MLAKNGRDARPRECNAQLFVTGRIKMSHLWVASK